MDKPKLIKKYGDEHSRAYEIEMNSKVFLVYDTVSERGNTHMFAVHSMKKSPTEEEENEAVLFVKRLTESKATKNDALISTTDKLPTTNKPWGKEVLLSGSDRYAMKEITVKAGQRTSLQYHLQKHETLVFIEGDAIIHHRNGRGEMIQTKATGGMVAEFPPLAPHRIQAVTDIRYFEASTPELKDDTVRLDDDYGRRTIKEG